MNKCYATSDDHASWPEASAFETVAGTCEPGWEGSPTRLCDHDGTFASISNPCTQIFCAAVYEGHGTWNASAAGTTSVSGQCDLGWAGSPSRECDITGNWGSVASPCVQLFCSAKNDSAAQATFPSAAAGETSISGTCYPNTMGAPLVSCNYDGTWSTVSDPCITNPCVALSNDQHANWPRPSVVDTVVTGTCVAGYDQTKPAPTRLCKSDGMWDSEVSNPCEPLFCTTSDTGFLAYNAIWPESLQAGLSTSGTCAEGSTGLTSRSCTLAGEWSTPSPVCVAKECAAIPDDGFSMSWPKTTADNEAVGQCLTGYEGTPRRMCDITGNWGPVEDPCTRAWLRV